MNALRSRTIQDVKGAAFVGQGSHAATSARAQFGRRDRDFPIKVFAIVSRVRQVDETMALSGFGTGSMPNRIYISLHIGCDGESTVAAFCVLHDVTLGLKRRA
jgi:hypothetical protein